MPYRHGAVSTRGCPSAEPFPQTAIPSATTHPTRSSTCRAGAAARLCGGAAVGNSACWRSTGSALHGSGACLGCCRAGCRPVPPAQSPAALRHEARLAAAVPGHEGGCAGARGRLCQAALQLGCGFGIRKKIPAAQQTPPEPGAGTHVQQPQQSRAERQRRRRRCPSLWPRELAGKSLPAPAQPVPRPGGNGGVSIEEGMPGGTARLSWPEFGCRHAVTAAADGASIPK